MSITELLKKMLNNPDDLTDLPGVIEQVAKLETEHQEALDKVGEMHELNRKYLSMIPIADSLEPEQDEQKPDPITFDDAVNSIMKEIQS